MTKAAVKKIKKVETRPPVVSILGHIDHGKTTLLDYIRKSNIQKKEAGGITQHIGAYQIEYQGQKISFIDTPGHAAFGQMRLRGAQATDLAVLVVAGDEGVKPQTEESYKYIKKAKIPFLVAVTKMDLPHNDLNRVKDSLARIGILVEGRGGDIVVVPVSAQTGEGVDELLEMISLLAQMQELAQTDDKPFEGVVIESRLDRSRGPVGTVLVKSGILKPRDEIWAGDVSCRVRAMEDEEGQRVMAAHPSRAVLVLGFTSVPTVGDRVVAKPEVNEACEQTQNSAPQKIDTKKLPLIIRADAQGTLEAVLGGLPKGVQVIDCGVGAVTENDVLLAQTTRASIQGFDVRVPGAVKKLAEIEKVVVKTYRIIYELFDEVERLVEKKKKPQKTEEVIGQAKVVKKFLVGGQEIAGGEVLKGRLAVGDQVRIERGKKVVGKAKISSLHQGREKIQKAKAEEEFGAVLAPSVDFKSGDMILSVLNLSQER